MTFENKYVEKHDCHYSRYIASWVEVGGDFKHDRKDPGAMGTKFAKWLKSIGLTEDEIWEVWNMATCGKLELQENAKKFLKGTGA